MADKPLLLLPIVLIIVVYVLMILKAGGVRNWAAQWRKKADAQGGPRQALLRTAATVLALLLITLLIQWLSR